jgi:hypothetical protein
MLSPVTPVTEFAAMFSAFAHYGASRRLHRHSQQPMRAACGQVMALRALMRLTRSDRAGPSVRKSFVRESFDRMTQSIRGLVMIAAWPSQGTDR